MEFNIVFTDQDLGDDADRDFSGGTPTERESYRCVDAGQLLVW